MRFTLLLIGLPVMAIDLDQPVAADDEALAVWAIAGELTRGPVDAREPDGALPSYGSVEDALGPADAFPGDPYPVVSLGDGGMITLRLSHPVADGPGADIVVFENGFDPGYLELAHVEVSSDGIHFLRFPSESGTQDAEQIGGFELGGVDPDDLSNLAGKYEGGFGTPFDLAELRGVDGWLDVSRVTHVRVIDVVGSIDPAYGSRDSKGKLINDPWPTAFPSAGFDLDAVAGVHLAPTSWTEWSGYHFPDGLLSGDEDDPDADGIVNLIEYAQGSDPLHHSTPALRMHFGGPTVELLWRRARERLGVRLGLDASRSDQDWLVIAEAEEGEDTEAEEAGVFIDEDANHSEVSASLSRAASRELFRLRATR